MVVKVVGHERVSGTSKKTGKPFDFYKVYVEYERQGVSGVCSDSLILQAASYPVPPLIGVDYNVDRDFNGYLISFTEA